jgi:uncharacterized protein (DUF1778 family)
MATPQEQKWAPQQKRSTRRQGAARHCRIAISVDENEQASLQAAARSEGLTVSAFVADRALAAAHHIVAATAAGPLREALQDLLRATTQLQRAGTNFNQCVAALNTTGQPPENLAQYARYTAAVVHRVDEAVTQVRQRLP